ncbi:MAG TPA: FtsW/RodA/SpoVE family cell cycle protein [Chlamydiales bacterium]|nr:FtsW/RodA/SpoVE family cell cycle protein [Chlamydiales bacterium]
MSLSRIDIRVLPLIVCLMIIGLCVISSMTADMDRDITGFWTPLVKAQLRWCCLGWVVFFGAALFDYRRLREWSFFLYIAILLLLIGLFFVKPIQNVHRWYRIPHFASIQPSEQAKLILVIALSWFLERKGKAVQTLGASLQIAVIAGLPFLLILKQPDLGTALVLYPITLTLSYIAGIHKHVFYFCTGCGLILMCIVACFFLNIVSHEKMRPFFTSFMKEYQYERLSPNTYHQKAAQTAIAIGGLTGSGWRSSEFSGRKWLPYAHTDSVFAAYGEEFGFVGIVFLLFLFYALIYFSFQVAAVARDPFGRLLAAGLAAYLAMHVLVNCAMMCALLPISGVPLILVTYGGSSLLTTMAALGLLQSIYSRRFMF